MPGPGVAALRREWPGAAYETLTIPKAIYWPTSGDGKCPWC